jgi:hypothetical protein
MKGFKDRSVPANLDGLVTRNGRNLNLKGTDVMGLTSMANGRKMMQREERIGEQVEAIRRANGDGIMGYFGVKKGI